jgi:uncharacterized membrane protein YkvA (DUF1232 family)
MTTVIGFFEFVLFLGFLLTLTLLICVAIPASKMRDACLQVALVGLAAFSVLYAVSPVDLIPFFPLDDMVVLAGGIAAAIQAWQVHKRQKASEHPRIAA